MGEYFFFLGVFTTGYTGSTDLVTWPLKCKLVESVEYNDAWSMQQGVRLIEGSTHVIFICYMLYVIFMHVKIKSKSDTFIYTFSRNLCFNSSLFWLKLSVLKRDTACT